jgi:hypothetical protein
MPLNSANVGVAVTGEISYGPTETTLPTTTAGALTGFTGLGYISTDGVTENPEVTREALAAWQNSATVRESITEARLTFTFTLIETTVDSVELYHGTSVTQSATEGTYVQTVGATKGRHAFVFDVVDGGEIMRKVIAEGEIFKGEGISYANGSAVGYPCELVAYTDPIVYDTRLKTSP